MTSWGREFDADARRPADEDRRDGRRPPRDDDTIVLKPDLVLPTSEAPTALELLPGDDRGVDPLPSTGSLVWAPDPTEPLPVPSADRPGAPGDPGSPDPTIVAPPAPSWPDPTGEPLGPGGRPPTPPTPPGRQGHRPPGPGAPPRPPAGGGRANPVVLGVVAVAVVLVLVAVLVTGRDGGDDESPAAGPAAALGDGAAGPIVGPTGVVGWWSGSEWVPRGEGDPPGAGLDYTVVGVDDATGTARGEAVAEDCPAQQAAHDVAVDLGGGDGPPPIAVAGVADPRPRPVDVWNPEAPVYQDAAAEVATRLGASTPVTVTQLLRTDLDGDGTLEVLVAAEHVTDPEGLSPEVGDWSVVFLRRVVGDGVATDVLASSVVHGSGDRLERIQIAALADLNGDGTMEVALAGRSASGEWTSIQAVGEDGTPREVLRAGCER
ncbi:MAG TPA: hypothetical protein VKZ72_08255 [Acidimicrobiales bacterium]|nr:hypothetical protein [Acidimicrobiales bacterium]